MIAACPLPWPRGTPIRIHRMAEALLGHGHDVTVLTYPLGNGDTPPTYRVQRVAPGSTMASGPGPSIHKLLYLDPLLARAVGRALRRDRYDVVHAHHYEGLLAALAGRVLARTPAPLVYDSHTLLVSELPHYRLLLPRRSLALIGGALDRRLPGRADHVIAVTDRMRDWLITEGRLACDRVSLISNGVESEHFGGPHALQPNGDGDRVARLVFAGNLAEYQGIDLLLKSFARVRETRPDVELVFVTGSDPAPLEAACAGMGLAGCVRALDDDYALLPRRLASAHVLVNPRVNSDGLPQKLLNYMAAGRPIVSFAGSAALLRHGETGLVVPDGDTDAFAAAVLRLLGDPVLSRRLGDAARRQVVAAHGWAHVAERVTAVYESLLGRRA
jgi:glycosyltransferase involved in cell wall biosynthesis